MTDMRATERLLEVIENRARSIEESSEGLHQHAYEQAGQILEEIAELRRRGDRRLIAAVERLENAIGGKV